MFYSFVFIPLPPTPTLLPYTTLFRSRPLSHADRVRSSVARIRGHGRGSRDAQDRKSTRLNSSQRCISYAVFCLDKEYDIVKKDGMGDLRDTLYNRFRVMMIGSLVQ